MNKESDKKMIKTYGYDNIETPTTTTSSCLFVSTMFSKLFERINLCALAA